MPAAEDKKAPKRHSYIAQFASSILSSFAPRRRDSVSSASFASSRKSSVNLFTSTRRMPRRRQSSMSAPPFCPLLLIKATEANGNLCTAGEPSPRSVQVKRRTLVSNRVLEKTLRRDTALRRQLENYAATRYESENVSFLEQVLSWKQNGCVESEANRICNTFVRENSEHQINISHGAREHTLEQCERGSVDSKLFDRAVDEISLMMVNGGIFHSFVLLGKLDGFDDRMSNGTLSY